MRHTSVNSGFVRKATGLKKGVVSILLFAVMTSRESLAVNSDEPIAKSTHRQNDQEKPRGIEPATNELPQEMHQLVKSAQQSYDKGRYKEAELFYRKAMALSETALGTDDPKTASIANNLALVVRSQARYAEAEALYRKALETHQRLSGRQHPAVAAVLHNLGEVCRHQGRFAEANALYDQALKIREARQEQDAPRDGAIAEQHGGALFRSGTVCEGRVLASRSHWKS